MNILKISFDILGNEAKDAGFMNFFVTRQFDKLEEECLVDHRNWATGKPKYWKCMHWSTLQKGLSYVLSCIDNFMFVLFRSWILHTSLLIKLVMITQTVWEKALLKSGSQKWSFFCLIYIFFVCIQYSWLTNTVPVLDPSNSVRKRFWCIIFCDTGMTRQDSTFRV